MNDKTTRYAILWLLATLTTAGCQSARPNSPLLVTPAVYTAGIADPFPGGRHTTATPEVFYATSRQPSDDGRSYLNKGADVLSVGTATVLLGDGALDASTLEAIARGQQAPVKGTATVERVVQTGVLPEAKEAWVGQINERLKATGARDLFVYVHGYKVGFEHPLTHAAQLQHVMGNQVLGIAYCWPSGQERFRYRRDIAVARRNVGELAALLQMLAEHTQARRIHVISYSAGATLAGASLERLRTLLEPADADQLRQRAKIGVAAFLSADVDLDTFGLKQVRGFYALCDRVTVTLSRNDGPLKLAGLVGGGPRLGSGWHGRLTPQDMEAIAAAERIDFVDLDFTDGPREGDFTGHHFWFSNAWGLSDLVLAVRYGLAPEQRGLARVPGGALWYFPGDYLQRLDSVTRAAIESSGG